MEATRSKPEWAKAAIVAEYQVDESDSQTDYFNARTTRRVFLGWSKSARVSFAELRKLAATFKPTAHLGPGRDCYTVAVVFANEMQDHSGFYYPGNLSHWHHEIEPKDDFSTQAEADAFIASAPVPEPLLMAGGEARFKWNIRKESYEHRENYSMGRGLMLGAGHYETGWTVEKRPVGGYCWGELLGYPGPESDELVNPPAAPSPSVPPSPVEGKPVDGAVVRPSTVRDGFVEVVHPAKPERPVIDELKAAGFRWAIRSRCWYGPVGQLPARYATPENLAAVLS